MKCPDCGAKLHSIQSGEWCCDNEDCPANKKLREQGSNTCSEYYGITQVGINTQRRVRAEKP